MRAFVSDTAQLLSLAAVDYIFVSWPSAHVPLIGRMASTWVLLGANALFAVQIAFSRAFPMWTARRIARTWCLAERARFFVPQAYKKAPR